MIFPSIFWKSASNNCSIIGAIPAPLSTESISNYGFAPIASHVRNRLTSPLSSTCSDYRYTAYSYNKLSNLSANHEDTRIILRRALICNDDKIGDLTIRGKGDNGLLQSFDSKVMVRNLCASQFYHNIDFSLTFTCNMRKHF